MKKIAFYGLGEQFEKHVIQNGFISEKLKKYKIAGFINQNKCGDRIVFNDICYIVQSLGEWKDFSIDKIFISSIKYHAEIRYNLKVHGYRDEQIETLEKLIFYLFDNADLIKPYICGKGLEIGGPSDVFSYIYDTCKACDGVNFCADTVWWRQNSTDKYIYGNRAIGKIYINDATNLTEISDSSYDFVISSNNLEHIANPIKAIGEFFRVLKKEGILIIVVPRKYVNFDHNRQVTSFQHILADYRNNIEEDDLSHLPEIIEQHDYDMDLDCGGKEAFIKRASENVKNRCLHHHVFDRKCLEELFIFFNLRILEFAETYSDYWMIGKK